MCACLKDIGCVIVFLSIDVVFYVQGVSVMLLWVWVRHENLSWRLSRTFLDSSRRLPHLCCVAVNKTPFQFFVKISPQISAWRSSTSIEIWFWTETEQNALIENPGVFTLFAVLPQVPLHRVPFLAACFMLDANTILHMMVYLYHCSTGQPPSCLVLLDTVVLHGLCSNVCWSQINWSS